MTRRWRTRGERINLRIAPLARVRGADRGRGVACAEFAEWDQDKSAEWTPAHDDLLDRLAHKYCVYGSIIPDTEFLIVEALT